jgi:hypothetical protein
MKVFFLRARKKFVSPCTASLQTNVKDPDPHPDQYIWGLPDLEPTRVRIQLRILPSPSKNSKKNLDLFGVWFLTSVRLFIFEE